MFLQGLLSAVGATLIAIGVGLSIAAGIMLVNRISMRLFGEDYDDFIATWSGAMLGIVFAVGFIVGVRDVERCHVGHCLRRGLHRRCDGRAPVTGPASLILEQIDEYGQ